MKIRLIAVSLFLVVKIGFSQGLKSGLYAGLGLIYLDRNTDTVYGYFENSRANGQISTVFYLTGIKDRRCSCFKVKTFYPRLDPVPDTIRGTIRPKSDTSFDMKLFSDPPGSLFGLHTDPLRPYNDEDTFTLVKKIRGARIAYINTDSVILYRKKEQGEKIRILNAGDFVEAFVATDDMYKVAIPEPETSRYIYGWLANKYVSLLRIVSPTK